MSAKKSSSPVSLLSIIVPAVVIMASAAGMAGTLGLLPISGRQRDDAPATVTVAPGAYEYRDYGEYFRNGFAVDAPVVKAQATAPLTIMKYQVTEKDYLRCVSEGACAAVDARHVHGPDFPVTGVSFDDATAYASWLSAATGQVWTLPSHEQMARAAGERFQDDALGVDSDLRNPAIRWLADYEREARRKAERDTSPRPRGYYGENEFGLADYAGNVWEWTTTCQRRVDLAGGDAQSVLSTCGIFVTVGQHRSPMSAFVRDPKTGGCSVGAPPANLGFRLVRDERWYALVLRRLRESGIMT